MTGRIYHSMVKSRLNAETDNGLGGKHFGGDWITPHEKAKVPSEAQLSNFLAYEKGFPLPRDAFLEALYVHDEASFARTDDLFKAGPFMGVKGKLAAVLSGMDLGEGGLVPIPIYEADRRTERAGPFYVLNFGARKDTLIGEQSAKVEFQGRKPDTGEEFWTVKFGVSDGDLAVRASAAAGADLWFDPKLWKTFFVSERFADALRTAGVEVDFELSECRTVGEGRDEVTA